MKNKSRYFLAELLGSCFLVMIIVGSGLMAENLTNDVAVMLIANTIATGACLLYTSPSPRDRVLSRMPSSA